MSLDVVLKDGRESNNRIKINGEGEMSVVVHPHPPVGEITSAIPVREFFSNGGSNDMRVDGSTSPVVFEISADSEKDKYIKTVSVVIADAGASMSEFAGLNTALTNGLQMLWETTDLGQVEIADGIKTNFEFVRLGLGNPAFNGGSAFIANNVNGTAEGLLPVIDLAQVFGFPWGLRLRAGSTDRICFVVNDDLSSGITQFDIIGYGIKI